MTDPSMLERVNRCHRSWDRAATSLNALGLIFGLLAIGLSLTVGAFSAEIGTTWTKLAGLAAAFLTPTAATLGAKGARFRDGWRTLNAALMIYDNDHDANKLVKQYLAAETTIGSWTVAWPASTRKKAG